MNNLAYERLHHNLQELDLVTIDEILDASLERASREGTPTLEVLDLLMEEERRRKDDQKCRQRMKLAGFPTPKNFNDFDIDFQPSVGIEQINELKTLRFIHNAENIVFMGPPGVGKTHLAIALGRHVVRNGYSAYFINAAKLMEKMKAAYLNDKLDRYLAHLAKYRLLIIDEIGYLPLDQQAAYCFFQLISKRYERSSTVFTSNKSYGQWGEIFNDYTIAAAILDRILHHCITFNMKGESYRMKDRNRVGIVPTMIQPVEK
jgi:DNA replication protein DnaC